jgi:hypothetical protein
MNNDTRLLHEHLREPPKTPIVIAAIPAPFRHCSSHSLCAQTIAFQEFYKRFCVLDRMTVTVIVEIDPNIFGAALADSRSPIR